MNKELIINSTTTGVEIALLEDKKLVELHNEKTEVNFAVGDIYLGKVHKLIPGLNAAFIAIGHEKDAFLHYTDLSPFARSVLKFTQLAINCKDETAFDFSKFRIEQEIVKNGKINDVLSSKPNILVQILKEPIAAKGPRLSCEISLPGRFIVITPFNEIVAVSKKIASSEERERLHKIISAIRPKNFGIIVRTAAEGKTSAELHQDVLALVQTWHNMQLKLKNAQAPLRILSEQAKATSMVRDLLNEDFNRIVVNDKAIYEEIKSYIKKIAPEKENIVALFAVPGANIFDSFAITKQIKNAFGKTVNIDSGAYLIIEHTEALHVIDVNSGSYKHSANSGQEETALATNLEAAAEIARQLRLRDLGGIIVVDFIDMKSADNRRKLQEAMANQMRSDRSRHTVLPISKFGLMQITRQRMRPEININTSEQCPVCLGTGEVSSTLVLEDDIAKRIAHLALNAHKTITLSVHPIFYSHITKGFFSSILKKWKRKYKINIKAKADSAHHLIEVNFFDADGEEIRM